MDELKPCPFCGSGVSEIHPNGRVWTGQRWGEPSSFSVRHWCTETPGQPNRLIERIGRDEASAVAAWNLRWLPVFDADRVAAESAARLAELRMQGNAAGNMWAALDGA